MKTFYTEYIAIQIYLCHAILTAVLLPHLSDEVAHSFVI